MALTRIAGLGTVAVLLLGVRIGSVASAPAQPYAAAGEDCTDCHDAIAAQTGAWGGLPFAHAPHVALEGGCLGCHGEHAGGEMAGVTVERTGCRTCHHGPARRGTALCERCHTGIYERLTEFGGRLFPHSVHSVPLTGLECTACHGEATGDVVASPAPAACEDCHP